MQLVGNNRVMVSIGNGYYELDISSGEVIHEISGFSGILADRRLPNGHTWLAAKGTMIELDENDTELRRVTFSEMGGMPLSFLPSMVLLC